MSEEQHIEETDVEAHTSGKVDHPRFHASDEQMRPLGRATSGVIGMRFNEGDELLGMHVVTDAEDVLVATEGGYAKRTTADQYPLRNRGGLGVMTAQITEGRGSLVGALVVRPEDEVFAITSNGGVIRTRASEVRQTGRVTMGVRLMNLAPGDTVVALARNAESESVDEVVEESLNKAANESPDDNSGNE